MQRTINSVEGWHSKFQRMLVTHHASIWKFIEHMRKDQRDNKILITQVMAGHQRVRHSIKNLSNKSTAGGGNGIKLSNIQETW